MVDSSRHSIHRMKIFVAGLDCAAPELVFGLPGLSNVQALWNAGAMGGWKASSRPLLFRLGCASRRSRIRYDLRVAQLEKGLMKNLDHPHRTCKFQTGYKMSSSLMLDGVILISTDTGELPSKALDSVSNDSSLSLLKRPRLSHTL